MFGPVRIRLRVDMVFRGQPEWSRIAVPLSDAEIEKYLKDAIAEGLGKLSGQKVGHANEDLVEVVLESMTTSESEVLRPKP